MPGYLDKDSLVWTNASDIFLDIFEDLLEPNK